MIPLDELRHRLGYDTSTNYRSTDGPFELETAHLFRAARSAGVSGIYVFAASPGPDRRILPARPAVYIAEASDEKEARRIHRSMWNLGFAPFLIVVLPHQVRIYTGFNYSVSDEDGLLDVATRRQQLHDLLVDFTSDAIDSGQIWRSHYGKQLNPKQRVDSRLLRNLEDLSQALVDNGLRDQVAHALIGKYVYLSYLRSRGILSEEWLIEKEIERDVFRSYATVAQLKTLSEAIEERFNGKVFPIDFEHEPTLADKHVSWVASVFGGAEIISTAPQIVQQLHLPFRAYDFQYIPVETLSAIYEQFIEERKEKGAIYTPEVLADYLISEMEWVKQLESGMRILDPACGSGVFLVLVYRRLIEAKIKRLGRRLTPIELSDVLQESIYGIERERDACYVAEFSLILTLLSYLEPRDLHNTEFQFPDLHNSRIFECDFFDLEDKECEAGFWQQELRFNWIVGNPPWIELKPGTRGEHFVRAWMEDPANRTAYPIGGNRVAEAFSWLVVDLLESDGLVGLVLPASTLFNLESRDYRRSFFAAHEVLRITNFANLRNVLFDERGALPATTIVYRQASTIHEKPDIVHYGPLSINQVCGARNKPWALTINENEIQTIHAHEAEKGETSLWKFALWGSYHDKRAIERIKYTFPVVLEDICKRNEWAFGQGAEVRNVRKSKDELEHIPELDGKRRFQSGLMTRSLYRYSVPPEVLEDIPQDMLFIRKRGGKAGLALTPAPHIIVSPVWMNYLVYSDHDFVIPPRQIGIAGSRDDEDHLRALSVYLKSSLVAYYLFFHAQQWGIFLYAKLVSLNEVKGIPTPELTPLQIEDLSSFHKELVSTEREAIVEFFVEMTRKIPGLQSDRAWKSSGTIGSKLLRSLSRAQKQEVKQFISGLRAKLRKRLDEYIFDLFEIPDDIRVLVTDFVDTRIPLDSPSTAKLVLRKPSNSELLAYCSQLRDELDDFAMGLAYHRVSITQSDRLIECTVEIIKQGPAPIDDSSISTADMTTSEVLTGLSSSMREQVSQWVYVQRGLRLFDGPRVYIYKTPRLIDWTRTQAMNDAGDLIGQAIQAAKERDEDTES